MAREVKQLTYKEWLKANPDVKICETCKGEGQIICENCGGDGNIECASCEGKGTEYEFNVEVPCKSCGGTCTEPCYDCEDGYIDCPDCEDEVNPRDLYDEIKEKELKLLEKLNLKIDNG